MEDAKEAVMPDNAKSKQPKSTREELEEMGLQTRPMQEWEGEIARPSDGELAAFESILREYGKGYAWLLDNPQKEFWSVGEIVTELDKVGLGVSKDAVVRWIKPLPHTRDFGGAVGLRTTRADLIQFFAQPQKPKRRRSKKAQQAESKA